MKYKINDTVVINNMEWVISEYRMGLGRQWTYTLSHEDIDGSYITMSLNERAMDGLKLTGGMMGSKDETQK
tara:strand:- start:275 stop:487 length:213 start_codon:yes stop_codon:yes gene_type:complete